MANLRYDFDFRSWPVSYRWSNTVNGQEVPQRRYINDSSEALEGNGFISKWALKSLSFVSAHTVVRRLAYPGTTLFWHWYNSVAPSIEHGRAELVEELHGRRFKLKTRTGNEIDSMFVDRRNDPQFAHGSILVITCEGNAGFYETGVARTPLEAQYSVLMWNHPGFGGSTGAPWPNEEAAAIDVVVQFALTKLGWDEGDVVIYGWSIGGYTATWAAMNYRNIRGLILDATFDDVLPLVANWAPQSWSTLVEYTVRTYMNLRIDKQLEQYNGPVVLVRRVQDEVMAAAAETHFEIDAMRRANRANHLVKSLLINRYPNVFQDDVQDVVNKWLAANDDQRAVQWHDNGVIEAECQEMLQNYIQGHPAVGEIFPLMIGEGVDLQTRRKMALYLVAKYMEDYDSNHCAPLPADLFHVPTHPWE